MLLFFIQESITVSLFLNPIFMTKFIGDFKVTEGGFKIPHNTGQLWKAHILFINSHMVTWLKKKFIQLKELTNTYINIYQVVKFTCFDIDVHSESLKCYKYHSECWKCYKVAPVYSRPTINWKSDCHGPFEGVDGVTLHYCIIPHFHRGRWLTGSWSESRFFMSDEFRRILAGHISLFEVNYGVGRIVIGVIGR